MEMITGMRGQILGHLRAQGFVRTKGMLTFRIILFKVNLILILMYSFGQVCLDSTLGSGDIRDLNQNSENWAVIKAALTAGAYPRIVKFNKETKRLSYQ